MPRKRRPAPKRLPGHLQRITETRWRFHYSVRGQRADVYVRAETEAEAWEQLAPTVALILQGRQPSSTKDWTVAQLLNEWLADVRPPAQRTLDGYQHYSGYVAKALGAIRLRDLTTLDITAWKNGLLAAGRAPTYVNGQGRILKMALKWAVQQGALALDPSLGVKLPRPERRVKPVVYTPEQLMALDAASGDAEYGRPNRIRLRTGLRPGEVCGLQWHYVDLEAGTATVVHQVVRLSRTGLHLLKPKSAAGERVVGLSPSAVAILREQKVWQNEWRVKLRPGVGWKNDHDLVFSTKFGTMLDPRKLADGFHAARTEAGLPYARPYDLRHAFATYQLAGGAPVGDVAQVMGHDPTMLLRVYRQMLPDMPRKLADAFERVLDAAKNAQEKQA